MHLNNLKGTIESSSNMLWWPSWTWQSTWKNNKMTNNKGLPHQHFEKSGRSTCYFFYLALQPPTFRLYCKLILDTTTHLRGNLPHIIMFTISYLYASFGQYINSVVLMCCSQTLWWPLNNCLCITAGRHQ